MKKLSKALAILLTLCMLLSMLPTVFAADAPKVFNGKVIADGADMLKYGHVDIDIPADDLLKEYALGDIVTVTLDGYGSFSVPVCASYDDVAAGEKLLRVVSGKAYVILAINYGQFAVELGIVEKAPEGAETAYAVKEGVSFPIAASVTAQKTEFEGNVIADGADMLKYGHIDIDIPADALLDTFTLGEIVTVELDGYGSFDVPICASYDDVAAGEKLLRVVSGKAYVILAINYGQFAVELGIVEKAPEGAETAYTVKEDVTFPIHATISRRHVESTVIEDGADMLKYGHIDIDYNADEFLKKFALGDTVTVELEGYGKFDVPVCASYDDVSAGEKLLRVVEGKTYLILAINYGQLAVELGIVEKAPEGADTAYTVKEDVTFPIHVKITLKKAAGGNENILGNLIRTDNREDYPALTDAQYANFRKVTTTGVADGILYRSSSPVNPEIGRNAYADAAAEAAGIKTFVNLADTEAEATGYPGYAETYYSAQNHIFLGLPVAFTTDTFKSGLANGFRYIIANEGPYLVHCTEGKDRAGLTSAILECLMGASYDEIRTDYTETYRNYYSVEEGAQRALTEKEAEACGDVITANLKLSFGTEINAETDLAAAAEAYVLSIGLSAEEVAQLKARLSDEPIHLNKGIPSSKRDDIEIPTYITLPKDYDEKKIYDMVMMIHGHGGNHNEWGGFDPITDGLAEKGVIAVTQDFSGCGASKESFRLNTQTNMKNDVLDVLAYMEENYNIDEVGVIGYSMGGRIVMELTAEELYSFDKIEFVAPAEDGEDIKGLFGGAENWEVLKAEANEKGYVEYTTIYATQELSKEWFADLEKYPDGLAEAAKAKYEGESLVIYATDDQAVSPAASQNVADIFGSEVINTRSGGHSYSFYVTDVENHPLICKQVNNNSVAFFTDGELKDYYEEKNPFEDVKETDWFYDYVMTMVDKGVIKGKTADTFAPEDDLTRAEMAVMLYRLAGEPAVEGTCTFTDVKETDWFIKEVTWAQNAEVIQGIEGGKLDPDGKVTREQLVVMMYRLAGEPETECDLSAFIDAAKVSSWAEAALKWAVKNAVIGGTDMPGQKGLFIDPQGNTTRAQAAKILCVYDALPE